MDRIISEKVKKEVQEAEESGKKLKPSAERTQIKPEEYKMKKRSMILLSAIMLMACPAGTYAHGHESGHHAESYESSSCYEDSTSVCESGHEEEHHAEAGSCSVSQTSGCRHHENCSGEYCGAFGKKKCRTRRVRVYHHNNHH